MSICLTCRSSTENQPTSQGSVYLPIMKTGDVLAAGMCCHRGRQGEKRAPTTLNITTLIGFFSGKELVSTWLKQVIWLYAVYWIRHTVKVCLLSLQSLTLSTSVFCLFKASHCQSLFCLFEDLLSVCRGRVGVKGRLEYLVLVRVLSWVVRYFVWPHRMLPGWVGPGAGLGCRGRVGWLGGCLASQQHSNVSQERICSDNCTCCHTKIEVADQTFYLTQPQYNDTGPSSPSADSIAPGA